MHIVITGGAGFLGLGLLPDQDFAFIVRDYLRENPYAVKLDISP